MTGIIPEDSQPDIPLSQEVVDDGFLEVHTALDAGILAPPFVRQSSRLQAQLNPINYVPSRRDTAGTNLNLFNSFALLDDNDVIVKALEVGIDVNSFNLEKVHIIKDLEIARHKLDL